MWQQPKTDWQSGDYFNIGDYNRIKGNINEIRAQALTLWPDFEFEEMGADKTYQDYGFYADEINHFEAKYRPRLRRDIPLQCRREAVLS